MILGNDYFFLKYLFYLFQVHKNQKHNNTTKIIYDYTQVQNYTNEQVTILAHDGNNITR